MTMTDGEICDALAAGEIEIDPIESAHLQIQPCSVDLRLSREVMTFRSPRMYPHGAPHTVLGKSLAHEMIKTDSGDALRLASGAFALGATIERVRLPAHILGRVEGRSSIGRTGLFVHITAGFIDPGFDGRITLEFFNASPRMIEIPFNYRICQLALFRLAQPCRRPYGEKRGSKYVGAAAAGVQPTKEEHDE